MAYPFQRFISDTVSQLSAPEYAVIFIGASAVIYYLVSKILKKRRLRRRIHRLIGLIFSILIALILIGLSTGLGLL